MKLQSKILLLVMPLVILPFLWLGWVTYIKLLEVSRQSSLEQMSVSLELVERSFENQLKNTRANIELFSKSSLLKKYVLTENEDDRYALLQPSLMRLFASYQRAYPEYFELRVLLPDGHEDIRSTLAPLHNETEMEGDSVFFRQMQDSNRLVYEMYTVSPDSGASVLYMGKRLTLRDESLEALPIKPRLRGYLVISVSIDNLQDQLNMLQIGSSGYLYVTDRSGNVLLRNNEIVKRYEEVEAKAGRSAGMTLREEISKVHAKGENVYVQTRQLHRDLRLHAILPEQDLYAAGRELGMIVSLATLATTLFASALIYVMINRILLQPIKRLGQSMQEVGRNRFDVKTSVDTRDEIGQLARSFEDMSCRLQQSQEEVSYLAYRDALTGLSNRHMFLESLSSAIAHARRHGGGMALLFLDLDNFKQVNDTMGHQAGDGLLKTLSDRLRECLRDEDQVSIRNIGQFSESCVETVARLGGDEFLILLPGIQNPHDAGNVAQRLLEIVSMPFVIDGNEFFVGVSIGISIYPDDGEDAETLVKNADIAMYDAKKKGRNNYQFFNESMNAAALARLSMENALRRAIGNQELMLHFQPKLDLNDGDIAGVEGLVRWPHPELGMMQPMQFIPLAEETGLIVPLGEWLIDEATKQIPLWESLGIDISISVNISTIQLNRQELAGIIRAALKRNKCPAAKLEIELTETSIMDAHERAAATLHEIRSLGVQVTMDDFGTGYSSFSSLRELPIEKLKIDSSFVRDIMQDQQDAAIVSAILAMARTLGIEVVAKGVETREQLMYLRSHRCDIAQGFLISRPLTETELIRLIGSKQKLFDFETMTAAADNQSYQSSIDSVRES